MLVYALLRSRLGLALTAIRDNETASVSLGIRIDRMKFAVYVFAAGMTGMVGSLVALQKLRISPDAAFSDRARKTYDAAICMYHDQALIPVKTLDMNGGVNITLGLSIVRTSPDHGTALDIAGRGVARAGSLIAAIELAAEVADRRRVTAKQSIAGAEP